MNVTPIEMFANEDEVWAWRAGLTDRKGGDPDQWPEYLNIREYPVVRA